MRNIFLIFLIFSTNLYSQNKIGNDVFTIEFLRISDNLQGSQNDYFTDLVERSMFNKNDSLKYGFLNTKGQRITNKFYVYASDFYNGKSNIILDTIPGLLFIDGSLELFPEYNMTFWYKGDIGLAIKNGKYGFINKNGEIIAPLIYEDAFPFYKGYASVKLNGNWNYINKKGERIFTKDSLIFSYKPIIDRKAVFMIQDNKVEDRKRMVSERGRGSQVFLEFLSQIKRIQLKEGLIGTNGKVYIKPIYDEISGYFINGYMRVRNTGKAGIINEKGEIIIPLKYDNVMDFKNGMFRAEKNNKWGIIDIQNNVVIPFEYSDIRHFRNGLALIVKNGKTGYINANNEMVIKPSYDFNLQGDFHRGIAMVKINKKFGYINKKNEIVIPIIYDKALPFKEKYTIVRKDGMSFLINRKGDKINNISKPYLWIKKEGLMRFAK